MKRDDAIAAIEAELDIIRPDVSNSLVAERVFDALLGAGMEVEW